jgi:hypothetical protein
MEEVSYSKETGIPPQRTNLKEVKHMEEDNKIGIISKGVDLSMMGEEVREEIEVLTEVAEGITNSLTTTTNIELRTTNI